jgi:NodT family efflux transporter outer membrane factor (OMF) lipoprotein
VACSNFYIKILILLLSLSLSGCMLGPDFHQQKAPAIHSYTAKPLPENTVAAGHVPAQHFIWGKKVETNWWTLFHSAEINALVHSGLVNSPNLAAALAALRQAQENLNAQIGNSLFPAVDLAATGVRQRFSPSLFGSSTGANVFYLFNTSVNVSYTLDIFGGLRRQIEALGATVDYQTYQVGGAYLSLTANIVTTAITTASLHSQIAATQKLLAAQSKQLAIIKKQLRLGGASYANVLAQETLVEQTRATIPPLKNNLARTQHALLVLVGSLPNHELAAIDLDALRLPSQLPVSLPSALLQQRPDVQAAQALLHAACAQIGVATANLFPQLNITGGDGWQSDALSSLLSSKSKIWNLTSNFAQPIFHGGALRAQRRAAMAAYDLAFAQYQQTVLQAFQNVSDVLSALEFDARTLAHQTRAEQAALGTLKLTSTQYHLGAVSYINLLNAEQQYQQVKINRIKAEALRFNDTVALFQSLGGGWWDANNKHE